MLTAGRPVSPSQYGPNPSHYISSNQSRSMSVPRIYYTRYAPRSYRELSPEATIAYLQFHMAPEYEGDYSLLQHQQDANYRPQIEFVGTKTTVSDWEEVRPIVGTSRPPPTYSTPTRQQQPPISARKHDSSTQQALTDKSAGFSGGLGVSSIAGKPELSTRIESASQQHLYSRGLSQSYQAQGAPLVETSQIPIAVLQRRHDKDTVQVGGVTGNVQQTGQSSVAKSGAVNQAEKQFTSPNQTPASNNQHRMKASLPEQSYNAARVPQQAVTPNRETPGNALQAGLNYHGSQVVGHAAVAPGRQTQALSTAQHSSGQKLTPGKHDQQTTNVAALPHPSADKHTTVWYSPQAVIGAASQQPHADKLTPVGYSQAVANAAAAQLPSAQRPTSGGYSPHGAIAAASYPPSTQRPTFGGHSHPDANTVASQHPSAQKASPEGYSQLAANAAALHSPPTQRPAAGGYSQQAKIAAASQQISAHRPTSGGYSSQGVTVEASQAPSAQIHTSSGHSQQGAIVTASQRPSIQRSTAGGYSQQAVTKPATQIASTRETSGYSQQGAVAAASQFPSAQKPSLGGYNQQAEIAAPLQQVGSLNPNRQDSNAGHQHHQGIMTMMSPDGGSALNAHPDQHRQQLHGPVHPTRPTNSDTGWVVDKQIVTSGRATTQHTVIGTISQEDPASGGTHLSRWTGDAPAKGMDGAQGIHGGPIADERQQMIRGGLQSPPKIGQASITGVGGIYGAGWVLDEKMPAAQRQPPQYNQMSASMPAQYRQSRLDEGVMKAATTSTPAAQQRSLSLPRIYYTRYSPRTYRELSPQATVAYLQYSVPMMESDY